MGKDRGYFPTSQWTYMLCMYFSLVLFIHDMNRLNSALKYSIMFNFSVQYMCMSAACILYNFIWCTFSLLIHTPGRYNGQNDEILFNHDSKDIIFIQIFESMARHDFQYFSLFSSILSNAQELFDNPPTLYVTIIFQIIFHHLMHVLISLIIILNCKNDLICFMMSCMFCLFSFQVLDQFDLKVLDFLMFL